MALTLHPGSFSELGATFDGAGTNFAVYSAHADKMELCLFTEDGKVELSRHALPERTGGIWHGYIPGLQPGTVYGYRAHGQYAPKQGHRFNPNKLLLDPYTRELQGRWYKHAASFGYQYTKQNDDLSFCKRDNAAYVAKSVVSDPSAFPLVSQKPAHRWQELLIYEAHVKGLTRQHPDVPPAVRGTYEGLASDAMLGHLLKLGISSIELLPVHAFIDEQFLLEKGLTNYWGYNSIGFFTPEPRYYGPKGLLGFRQMVERFHAAGIEVILDVVYNHTVEGDQLGPTLSFRGLDNASYYRLNPEQPRFYINDTGCGNTLNLSNPYVLRMVMDSLRFWVQHMGIDGFRFDLATTLAREIHGFDPGCGFLDAIRQDPVLRHTRLIAEPWDVGMDGYQLGQFPPEFAEWNDQYRDTVRRFWRGDEHGAQQLADCLLGSAKVFEHHGRSAWASINMLTSHDGFTLADVTRYNDRHNDANLENNQDGHHANFSDNCGVEGETDDAQILSQRQQRQRNLLATLFLSQGTPMLLAGDEIGNSQQGNNNAYCQDNPLGWINWEQADHELLDFVQRLSQFRREHHALRQPRFIHGKEREKDGLPDVVWSDFQGHDLDWDNPQLDCFCLTVRCALNIPENKGLDVALLIFNRSDQASDVLLPVLADGQCWMCAIDTNLGAPSESFIIDQQQITIQAASVMALHPSPQE